MLLKLFFILLFPIIPLHAVSTHPLIQQQEKEKPDSEENIPLGIIQAGASTTVQQILYEGIYITGQRFLKIENLKEKLEKVRLTIPAVEKDLSDRGLLQAIKDRNEPHLKSMSALWTQAEKEDLAKAREFLEEFYSDRDQLSAAEHAEKKPIYNIWTPNGCIGFVLYTFGKGATIYLVNKGLVIAEKQISDDDYFTKLFDSTIYAVSGSAYDMVVLKTDFMSGSDLVAHASTDIGYELGKYIAEKITGKEIKCPKLPLPAWLLTYFDETNVDYLTRAAIKMTIKQYVADYVFGVTYDSNQRPILSGYASS